MKRLEPPYDKKGNVTPVTGKSPVTTPMLIKAWTNKRVEKPNNMFLPNGSEIVIDALYPLKMI